MKECPFCKPELDREQEIVLSNAGCLFLQKPNPVLIGSGVIVPRKHRETLFDLTEEEWIATYSLLKKAKEYLDEKYAPQGYNVGWNVGEKGGQEIFHAHLHILPRYADEPLAGKGIRYYLKQKENRR